MLLAKFRARASLKLAITSVGDTLGNPHDDMVAKTTSAGLLGGSWLVLSRVMCYTYPKSRVLKIVTTYNRPNSYPYEPPGSP